MKRDEYIRKWLKGDLSEDEKHEFERSEDFKSLEKLSSALQSFKAPDYEQESELNRLKSLLSLSKKARVVSFNWTNTILRIAAAVTILMGVYFVFFYNVSTVIRTEAGEKSEFYLPDSSLVVLNANSKLSFVFNTWPQDRKVTIEGEAFFKVATGSKFKVNSKTGMVTVLGTEFNVKDRRDYYEVTCYEGLVGVIAGDDELELMAKESFRIIDGNLESRDIELVDLSPSWINEKSSFESVPFSHVISEFEFQYGQEIDVVNVETEKLFTGSFDHNSLELALEAISRPLNLKYQITQDGNIILKGERN